MDEQILKNQEVRTESVVEGNELNDLMALFGEKFRVSFRDDIYENLVKLCYYIKGKDCEVRAFVGDCVQVVFFKDKKFRDFKDYAVQNGIELQLSPNPELEAVILKVSDVEKVADFLELKRKRVYTPEQLEALRARAAKARLFRKKKEEQATS